MATTPVTPAQRYFPQVDKSVDPKVTTHLTGMIYPALNDHESAIYALSGQVQSLLSKLGYKVSGNAVTPTSSNAVSASSSSGAVTASQASSIAKSQAQSAISSTLGRVNTQTGDYTTQGGDYAGVVSVNASSAATVTLNPSVNSQWYAFVQNNGGSTVTLQPGTGPSGTAGTINGNASLAVKSNQGTAVFFDGRNWSTSGTQGTFGISFSIGSGEQVTGYDSNTGQFTTSTLSFSDITGNLDASQLPTSGISATITTAALTPTGSQGSMTFTNGILTSQVQAT